MDTKITSGASLAPGRRPCIVQASARCLSLLWGKIQPQPRGRQQETLYTRKRIRCLSDKFPAQKNDNNSTIPEEYARGGQTIRDDVG